MGTETGKEQRGTSRQQERWAGQLEGGTWPLCPPSLVKLICKFRLWGGGPLNGNICTRTGGGKRGLPQIGTHIWFEPDKCNTLPRGGPIPDTDSLPLKLPPLGADVTLRLWQAAGRPSSPAHPSAKPPSTPRRRPKGRAGQLATSSPVLPPCLPWRPQSCEVPPGR